MVLVVNWLASNALAVGKISVEPVSPPIPTNIDGAVVNISDKSPACCPLTVWLAMPGVVAVLPTTVTAVLKVENSFV